MPVVVRNPSAGSVDRTAAFERLRRLLPETRVRESATIDELSAIVRDAVAERTTIVAAGGDGTLGAVVAALGGDVAEVTLGILPCGTGNDFARGVGIPLDLDAAVDVVAAGHVRPCDLIEVGDADGNIRRFLNVAVGAFDESQMAEIETRFKGSTGLFGYLAAAEEALRTRRSYRLTVTAGDSRPVEIEAVAVVAANGPSMSAGIPVVPRASPDDGRLDLLVVEAVDVVTLAALAPMISAGLHADAPAIRLFTAARFEIASDPPLPLRVDDDIAVSDRWTFTVAPRAVGVIAPAPTAP